MKADDSSSGSEASFLAEQFLDRLQAGEDLDEAAVAGLVPTEAPALLKRLKVLKRLHEAGKHLASASSVRVGALLRCPHCGHSFTSVHADIVEIACPSCRSRFRVARGDEEEGRAIPERLGRFEVLGLLGRGSFGAVYKARDAELDRFVAVKVPRAGELSGKEDEERFLREARSAARLSHPSIVKVHEVGVEGGLPFLVSDFVPGPTLAEVIATDRPSFKESAALVARLAFALDHAHGEKVVHRDVKPGNILIGDDGSPHVSDFGLARREEEEVTVTLDGQILGTPAYMAPEQAAGDHARVGPASDQYAIGVILYELLTGERPFRGSRSMIIQQVLNDDPRTPRSLNDRVPRDLETICLKSIAKEPSRRYETCLAMARDLEAWLEGGPITARPISRPERAWRLARRNPGITLLGVAVIATAIVSTVLAYRMTVARNDANDQLAQLHAEQGAQRMDDGDLLGSLRSFARALRLKPGDDRRKEAHRIRSGSILERCPRLLNVWFHPEPIYRNEMDPQGKHVATMTKHAVRIVELTRSEPVAELDVEGYLRSVVFSPDGSTLGVTIWGHSGRVWPWREAPEQSVVLKGSGEAAAVSFYPDGSRVLVCGPKETRIFDVHTGKPVSPAFPHPQGADRAVFSPDGSNVATAGADWTARVWDATTAEPITPPLKHWGLIHHITYSHDGRLLATASDDRTARIWRAATGEPLGEPLKHDATVWHVAFSEDDARIVTSCLSTYASVWDLATGTRTCPPLRHQTNVYQAVFRFDGRSVLTASSDGTARLWDVLTGEELTQPLRHGGDVYAAWFLPDGHRVVTGGEDGCLKLWDTARGEPRVLPQRSNNPVGAVAFSPDGQTLAFASYDSTAGLLDVSTGESRCPWLRHSLGLSDVSFSPDGRLVATCSWDGTTQLWDGRSGAHQGPTLVDDGTVHDLAFSPDGELLATASGSNVVSLWSTATGARVRAPLLQPARPTTVEFRSDGKLLAVATDSPVVLLWSVRTGERLHELFHGGFAKMCAFHPDGRSVVTASTDGRTVLWDVARGTKIAETLPHSNDVLHVRFSPDGSRFASASADGTARIWNAADATPLTSELRHHGAVTRVEFSPGSALLATASGDGSARVWDAATGDPLTPRLLHGGKVLCVEFSPDGRMLATGAEDNCTRLWSLRTERRPIDEVEQLALLLSHRVSDPQGSLVPAPTAEFQAAWKHFKTEYPEEFEASTPEVIGWHGREAEACMKNKMWRAAVAHYDRFIAGMPKRFDPYKRRGNALASLREWRRAAADFERAFELGSDSTKDLRLSALAYLVGSDRDGYRRVCELALAQYAGTKSRAAANTVAWTVSIGAGASSDPSVAVEMSRRIVAGEPGNYAYVNTLATALLRAGAYEESVTQLLESIRLKQENIHPIDWSLFAIAHAHHGDLPQAREDLAKARTTTAAELQSKPATDAPFPELDWVRTSEVELFLSEAEAAVAKAEADKN